MDMEKKQNIFFIIELIILFALSVFVGASAGGSLFFGDINMIDEGQFGAWANHMLQGKHMYKDIYITYGPLYVYPLYVLFKIFGPSAFLTRFYLITTSVTGIIAVAFVLRKLDFTRLTRWFVLSFFVLLPIINFRQGFGFIVIFCLIKVFETKKYIWNFYTGFFIVTSFLVSPDVGVMLSLITFIVLVYEFLTNPDVGKVFKKLGMTILGVVPVITVFILWSVTEGWFTSYLATTSDVFTTFSGINLPNGQNFPNPLQLIPMGKEIVEWVKFVFSKEMLLYWLLIFYIFSLFYLIIKFTVKIKSKEDIVLVLLVLYGFFLYPILIGRSGIGHFFFVLSPSLIIAPIFLKKLFFIFFRSKNIEKIFAGTLIFLIFIFGLRLILINRPQIIKNLNWFELLSLQKENPSRVGSLRISQQQKTYINTVQEFIKNNTVQNDKVFFLNDEPMMYLLVDRLNPVRYDLPYIANIKEKRLEILNSFYNNPPKYIFENTEVWKVDGVSNRVRLPEVICFINQRYKRIAVGDHVNLYVWEK